MSKLQLICAFLTATCYVVSAGALIAQESKDAPELPLAEAIQIALMNNRPVKIAQLDISKSRWQLASSKTKRFPEISTYLFASGNLNSPSFTFPKGILGTIDGTPNGTPIPSKDTKIALSTGMTGYATVSVTQPITQLYKIGLYVHEQQLELQLSKEKYRGKQQSTVADVKQAYYAVLQTESALQAQLALVKQYEETYRLVQQYLAQESVLKSSSLDAKAKLADAQYQIIQLGDTLQTQKEQLNTILGRDLDTPFRTQQIPLISDTETI